MWWPARPVLTKEEQAAPATVRSVQPDGPGTGLQGARVGSPCRPPPPQPAGRPLLSALTNVCQSFNYSSALKIGHILVHYGYKRTETLLHEVWSFMYTECPEINVYWLFIQKKVYFHI